MDKRSVYEDICGGKGGHSEGLEALWAHQLERDGWDVQATCAHGQGGGDGGFDLKADRGDERKIVEVKCNKPGNTVGRPELLKAEGARVREDGDITEIVTTSSPASGKERDIENTEVVFVHGDDLIDQIDEDLYEAYRSDGIEESPATCHPSIQ
jgi:hypothetical protein